MLGRCDIDRSDLVTGGLANRPVYRKRCESVGMGLIISTMGTTYEPRTIERNQIVFIQWKRIKKDDDNPGKYLNYWWRHLDNPKNVKIARIVAQAVGTRNREKPNDSLSKIVKKLSSNYICFINWKKNFNICTRYKSSMGYYGYNLG